MYEDYIEGELPPVLFVGSFVVGKSIPVPSLRATTDVESSANFSKCCFNSEERQRQIAFASYPSNQSSALRRSRAFSFPPLPRCLSVQAKFRKYCMYVGEKSGLRNIIYIYMSFLKLYLILRSERRLLYNSARSACDQATIVYGLPRSWLRGGGGGRRQREVTSRSLLLTAVSKARDGALKELETKHPQS